MNALELVGLYSRQTWIGHAACRGIGPALMYPNRGDQSATTKAMCATCPVRTECAEAGQSEYFGIWGGEDAEQRAANRQQRNKPTPVRTHGTISGYEAHRRRGEVPVTCTACVEGHDRYHSERRARLRYERQATA